MNKIFNIVWIWKRHQESVSWELGVTFSRPKTSKLSLEMLNSWIGFSVAHSFAHTRVKSVRTVERPR
jgi:hypothetical protein